MKGLNTQVIDTLRKRNSRLHKEVDELKLALDLMNVPKGNDKVDTLVNELELIRTDWSISLAELKMKTQDCDELLRELVELRKIVNEMGFKVPLYRKIFIKLKMRFEK